MCCARTLGLVTATALLVGGCSAPGKVKNKDCVACQSGGTYYYDSTTVPPASEPYLNPTPVPESVPAPSEVPPLPGTAAQPSRIQQMRAATTTFLMNTGHQVRALFTR